MQALTGWLGVAAVFGILRTVQAGGVGGDARRRWVGAISVGALGLAAWTACGDPVTALRRTLAGVPLSPVLSLYLGLVAGVLLRAAGVGGLIRDGAKRASAAWGSPAAVAAGLSLFPLVFALPCGHGLALAVLVAVTGPDGGMGLNPAQSRVLGSAFLRTAYGACAAAALGGIARVGEAALAGPGMPGSTDRLRAPQLFSLVLAAGATAVFARALRSPARETTPGEEPPPGPPEVGSGPGGAAGIAGVPSLLALVFLLVLFASAHVAVRRVDPLTWLAAGVGGLAIVAGLAGRIAPSRVLSETPAGPVVDMALGLLLAGGLEAAGGFRVIGDALALPAGWAFPGPAGVMILLIHLPLLLPLACGRVVATALIPLVASAGPLGAGVLTTTGVTVCVGAFTLFAAMSCVVSPAGGCLAWARGAGTDLAQDRVRDALNLAAIGTAAPLLAAYLRWMSAPRPQPLATLLAAAAVIGAAWLVLNRLVRPASVPEPRRGRLTLAFATLGLLSGAATAGLAGLPLAGAILGGGGAGALAGGAMALVHPEEPRA